ncbi:hypothetical protein HYC85_013088 [Camellia sinensis]|uniref:Uncharacterized protein n=1 Tax=Camellia sinensis TaxID=4442 RepID=A0A7J7HEN8_CAMSI|nr:hypothetical protein HYC85_013088 [Camellia sinensis]
MVQGHIILLTFPAQGHINPCLQFSKRLLSMGVHVTFTTSLSAQRRMTAETPKGLKFVAFSDGYDDGSDEGRPVTCLVYTFLLPWVAAVARDCHVPFTLLWFQPAAVLDIYYYYFNGYKEDRELLFTHTIYTFYTSPSLHFLHTPFVKCVYKGGLVCVNRSSQEDIVKNHNDPSWSLELPGLPRLYSHDLPSFVIPSSSNTLDMPIFKELMDTLDEETNPKVLVNTCDALEPKALKAIQNYNLIGIGPLIPSAFLDGQDPSDTSFGGDLFPKSREYIEWLNSKPQSLVVYISFGTMIVLPKQ